jgi:hypothetical protein
MQAVPAPTAPLGASDATRRWCVVGDDGQARWPGLTRVEADAVCAALGGSADARVKAALIQVDLGVVISDGAGPYLVDADGVLVLVLDLHAHIARGHITMGQVGERRTRIGLVRGAGHEGIWEWVVQVQIDAADRVAVLDQLAAVETAPALVRWCEDVGLSDNPPYLAYGRPQRCPD